MKAKRAEQIWIKPNKDIGNLSHISKNLYNESNYAIRQEFIIFVQEEKRKLSEPER